MLVKGPQRCVLPTPSVDDRGLPHRGPEMRREFWNYIIMYSLAQHKASITPLLTHIWVRLLTWVLFQDGCYLNIPSPLRYRHNGCDGVSNHQPHDCLLNRSFRRRSKKTPKLRVTGLCEGNSPVTGEFPSQRASNAENASIWWRHHALTVTNSIQDLSRERRAVRL